MNLSQLLKNLAQSFTLLLFGGSLAFNAQAAVTYNANNGVLLISAVSVDSNPETFTVTLQQASGSPKVGDQLSIQAVTPNTTSSSLDGTFYSTTNLAYFPQVQLTTA